MTTPAAHTIPAPPRSQGGPTDPSHDDQLRRGILHTQVSRPVAALMAGVFVVAIVAVPVGQAIADKINGDASVLPDLFKQAPTRDGIKQFEDDLEKASTAREQVRPRMQSLLVRYGGYGNSKAVIGRNHDWLFYQPGLAAVGGPGLLDRELMAARQKAALDQGGTPVHPDPRPAILDLHRYLRQRGIALVILPVPDKAALQPVELHGRAGGPHAAEAAENPDFARLVAELRREGVAVFDPTPRPLAAGATPRFLAQDTHWTPAWMGEVAVGLARFLTGSGLLSAAPAAGRARAWRSAPRTVSRVGDIVDMLGLPEGQTLFPARAATVDEVRDGARDGAGADADSLFAPAESAELLLLGDSFANVFSLGQMGWGQAAGLAPQLARALARDVDVLAQNDSGAHATRQLLWNALGAEGAEAAKRDRLSNKKVVIWEFASRELAVGNWKPLDWSAAARVSP